MTSPSSAKLERTSTPGIYRRGSRYVVTYRDPMGKPRKRFAPTLAAAKTLKASIATDIQRGEFRDIHRARFGDYALNWIDRYAGRTSKGVLEETRLDYKARIEQDAIPLLGRLPLAEITAAHLDLLAARVASGPLCPDCRGRGFARSGEVCRKCERKGRIAGKPSAPGTVRLSLAPVKAMFADAVQRGDLRVNPAAGYRTKHAVPSRDVDEVETPELVKVLSEEQLAALLDGIEAESMFWRPFFEFLAQTGLRIGEAIEVRWSDLDLGKKTLRVSRAFSTGRAGDRVGAPKTKYGRRTIRLSDGMAKRLWLRQATEKPDVDNLVWTGERGRRVDQSNLMSRVLKPAAVRAGLGTMVKTKDGERAESWVGFHTFRHTCATTLFRHGMNAVQVQRWLGHHKPSFTLDVYVHLLDEDLTDETAFLDAMVGNARATSASDTGRDAKSENDAAEPRSVALRRAVSG